MTRPRPAPAGPRRPLRASPPRRRMPHPLQLCEGLAAPGLRRPPPLSLLRIAGRTVRPQAPQRPASSGYSSLRPPFLLHSERLGSRSRPARRTALPPDLADWENIDAPASQSSPASLHTAHPSRSRRRCAVSDRLRTRQLQTPPALTRRSILHPLTTGPFTAHCCTPEPELAPAPGLRPSAPRPARPHVLPPRGTSAPSAYARRPHASPPLYSLLRATRRRSTHHRLLEFTSLRAR
jgi:hypothetical protein